MTAKAVESIPVELPPLFTEPPGTTTPGNRPRRTIFLDVENTSSEEALYGALEHLKIDRSNSDVDLVAVGNWRVIGAHVARMLAQRGARLLHSAPATGVKDWSDLAIAVQAGICLGRARPGDSIAIVSADRAFDAVADAAATLGVEFRRLTYGGVTSGLAERIEPADATPGGRRRRRGGRGRRRPTPHWSDVPAAPAAPAVHEAAKPRSTPAHAPASRAVSVDGGETKDIQGATHEQVVNMIARLSARAPERGVNLDLLINALKTEGFGRPPGSPRLVTRLRMMKDVEVSPTGMVRLVNWPASVDVSSSHAPAHSRGNGAAAPEDPETPADAAAAAADAAGADAETSGKAPAKAKSRRRGNRGGRGRRKKTAPSGEKGPDTPSDPT